MEYSSGVLGLLISLTILAAVFFTFFRIKRVGPTDAMIILGWQKAVRKVKFPGVRIYFWPFDKIEMATTRILTVNIDTGDVTTFINSGEEKEEENAPARIRIPEASIYFQTDFLFQDPKQMSPAEGENAETKNIDIAEKYLKAKGQLFDGDPTNEKKELKPNQFLIDKVQAAFRRHAARHDMPFMKIIYDEGAAANAILTNLRAHQAGTEEDENFENPESPGGKARKELRDDYYKLLCKEAELDPQIIDEKTTTKHKELWEKAKDKLPPERVGVCFTSVEVNTIDISREDLKTSMEDAAVVIQKERADILEAKRKIRVAELEIAQVENQAKAHRNKQKIEAEGDAARIDIEAEALRLGDNERAFFELNKEAIQAFSEIAKAGNSTFVVTPDILKTAAHIVEPFKKAITGGNE